MDEKQAIQLLRKHATSDKDFNGVLKHSKTVQRVALEVAEKISAKHPDMQIDIEFIRIASLLHDIGRFKCPPGPSSVRHGMVGAEILRKEGVDERFAHVCERHLGAGITEEEIREQGIPLPPQDYTSQTIEEKIIAYADNLLWGDEPKDSAAIVKRFTDELGEKVGLKIKNLHDEIEDLMQ